MRRRAGALIAIVVLTIGPAPAAGNAAANRKLVERYFVDMRITGGRIGEVWVNMDVLGMMQQLGAIPGMTPPPPQ